MGFVEDFWTINSTWVKNHCFFFWFLASFENLDEFLQRWKGSCQDILQRKSALHGTDKCPVNDSPKWPQEREGKRPLILGWYALISQLFFFGGGDVYSPKPLKYPIFFWGLMFSSYPKLWCFFVAPLIFSKQIAEGAKFGLLGWLFVFKKGSLAYTPPKNEHGNQPKNPCRK